MLLSYQSANLPCSVMFCFFFTLCAVAYTNTETTAHPSLREQSATAQTSRLKCPFRFLPSHLSIKWPLRCSWSSHRDCGFPFLFCISSPPPVLRGAKLRRRRPWRTGYLTIAQVSEPRVNRSHAILRGRSADAESSGGPGAAVVVVCSCVKCVKLERMSLYMKGA